MDNGAKQATESKPDIDFLETAYANPIGLRAMGLSTEKNNVKKHSQAEFKNDVL